MLFRGDASIRNILLPRLDSLSRRHCAAGFLLAAALTPIPLQATTLTVATEQDEVNANGSCSLREAILNANNNDQTATTDCPAGEPAPVVDEIRFDASLNGTPIEISLQGAGDNAGDLNVSESVAIIGNGLLDVDPAGFAPGQANTVLSAAGLGDRIMSAAISDGASRLRIADLAMIDGEAAAGGALFVGGSSVTVELESVVFSGNEALDGGGGAVSASALLLDIDSALFLDNRAGSSAGQALGGAVSASSETVDIADSGFFRNVAEGATGAFGGAVFVSSVTVPAGEQLLVDNSVFEANEASDNVDSVSNGDDRAYGGAIYKGSGVGCRITRSTITGNKVIAADNVTIGGGVVFDRPEGSCLIENTTISDNIARSDAPSPTNGFSQGGGLGLLADDHQVDLNNVTITSNSLRGAGSNSLGGGVFAFDYDSGNSTVPTFVTSNTIIAGNIDDVDDNAPDCFATLQSTGHTLLGDNRFCDVTIASGDLIGDVDGGASAIEYEAVFVGGAQDNGGGFPVGSASVPHKTHALYPASLAVDAADAASCAMNDQRGVARPLNGDGEGDPVCDMGAFELEPLPDLIFEDRFEP